MRDDEFMVYGNNNKPAVVVEEVDGEEEEICRAGARKDACCCWTGCEEGAIPGRIKSVQDEAGGRGMPNTCNRRWTLVNHGSVGVGSIERWWSDLKYLANKRVSVRSKEKTKGASVIGMCCRFKVSNNRWRVASRYRRGQECAAKVERNCCAASCAALLSRDASS